jgi:MinD-like ATPase involved in chromosome partitioning or flagellar assembly
MSNKILRVLLILLDGFLAITAIAGGLGLLTGVNAPPVSDLAGSPFSDYTIPGLALLVLVGGTATVATYLTVRRHPYAALVSSLAAAMIIAFEIVEVLVIGMPPGIARNLQVFYLTLGLIILVTALAYWAVQRKASPAA